ncbi:MAG: DEAD/DEAH box helicase [Bacteroidota bacterium]|nr:DEAD/DEAH box helicase [Bacteroidota bacterium]
MDHLPTLIFYEGMLQLRGEADKDLISIFFKKHPLNYFISPAYKYSEVIKYCEEKRIAIENNAAKFYEVTNITHSESLDPFDFQIKAIEAWEKADKRGMVVLPTGAGKSFMTRLLIARLAIEDAKCSVLVVVPTRVLVYQWYEQLRTAFQQDIGIIGDDIFNPKPITVTTYKSAQIYMATLGNRWKLVVYDEIHKKLSEGKSANAARFCMSPYRLALTATPVSSALALLSDLIGPIVYEKATDDLIENEILSVYRRISVHLKPAKNEIETYYDIRKPIEKVWYRAKAEHRIQDSSWLVRERLYYPDDVDLAQRSLLRAYRYWQSIPSRLARLEEILQNHQNDRILIFTESRYAAYEISKRFLIPAITADIESDERSFYLDAFTKGKCRALVTAKALEEGIDLPEANVAVIIAGRKNSKVETISYIQRRGRVLRKRKSKEALVYEISFALPIKVTNKPAEVNLF